MMNESAFAVLVGINTYLDRRLGSLQYAEKDCQDLYRVLTDATIGTFPSGNVIKLLGEQASLDNILESLFTNVVLGRSSSDTVLVYYSGHGFVIPDFQKTYLATHDVSVMQLFKNPTRGLSMDLLHDEIFMKSKARNVIFILDTCYSGAIVPTALRDSTSQPLITDRFFSTGRGRIALVSCPPDAQSRESSSLKNGIFTHYLLKGLRGEAVEADTGEVTVDSLLAYVRKQTLPDQSPGRYGQDFGRIVLARPGQVQIVSQALDTRFSHEARRVEFVPLRSPLEPFETFIGNVVGLLETGSPIAHFDPEPRILEAIRRSSEADLVLLIRSDGNRWVTKSSSDFEHANRQDYVDSIMSRLSPGILGGDVLNPEHMGLFSIFDEPETKSQALALVPLRRTTPYELMVVCGLHAESHLLNEPFSQILAAMHSASQGFLSIHTTLIEAAILDHLRRLYGFVPLNLYNRRFELFGQRLQQMIIHFQPVLFLSKKNPYICGWEALARDPENLRSPQDLFNASELWGSKFAIELDTHFIKLATSEYHSVLSKTPGRQRPEDIQDLSVNVYPQSLLRTACYKAIAEVIRDESVPAERLFLEISEKMPFPQVESTNGVAARWGAKGFRELLENYVSEFGIGFAIDDFGVGYSSVSRLASLHPSYVKVDREIMTSESVYDAIKFVLKLVNDLVSKKYLRTSKFVLEGFDSNISLRVSLRQLYDMGVRYIQGHIIGEPGPDLPRLDQDTKAHLISLIANSQTN